MKSNILHEQYRDVLGINPGYEFTLCNELTDAGFRAMELIINQCANAIINYDKIRAQKWHEYTFGVSRHKDGKLHMMSFTTSNIEFYCGVRVAGATMKKLVNQGLLVGKGSYKLPDDFFTTNDLSIGLYRPIDTNF